MYQEDSVVDCRGHLIDGMNSARVNMMISFVCVYLQVDSANITVDDNFGLVLEYKFSVNLYKIIFANSKTSSLIDHLTIRNKLGISPIYSKKIVKSTTEIGVCNMLHP